MKKRFDTSGYSKDDNRPLPIGENKNMIGLMKDYLRGKILTELVALREKIYTYRKIEKKWRKSAAKAQKSVWFLKALRLMITRPACLMVK